MLFALLLLLSAPAQAAPLYEAAAAATLDRIEADQTPEGTHLVWVQVLRRPAGDDGAPRTLVKLLRPVRKGHTVVFQPTRHKVELVGWLPKAPVWQLPVTWDEQGRIWQAWDEGIEPEYVDPQLLPRRADLPLEDGEAWLGDPRAAARLVFDTLYDEFRLGKPTTVGTVTWLARVRRQALARPPEPAEYRRVARERREPGIVPLWPGEWKLTIGRCDPEALTHDASVDPVTFRATFAADGGLEVGAIQTHGLTRDASAHGFLRLLDRQRPRTPSGAASIDRTFGLSVWTWEEDGDEGAFFGSILGAVTLGAYVPHHVSDDCSRVLAP